MWLGSKRNLPGLDAELLMNRNLMHLSLDYYKYLKRSRSELSRNAFFDLKQLGHFSAQPGISSVERFCNGFDSDTIPDVLFL